MHLRLLLSKKEIKRKSNLVFNSDDKEIGVKIFKEDGDKCSRCWKLYKQLDENNQICDRCRSVINEN